MIQQASVPSRRPRPLSERQIGAIRTAMRLFVDDDVAQGRTVADRLYCDACELPQPAAGFIRYGRYQVCNACATEYEIVQARGLAGSIGQFVRGRRFGERLDLLLDSALPGLPVTRPARSRS